MALTVSDLLIRKPFNGMRLAAGKAGTDREIHWVNIMEILDSPGSVAPYELLFTTGHGIGDSSRYRDVIRKLAQGSVSGLVIQLGVYLDKVPDHIIEQAELFGFPVLTIPKNITFSAILHTMVQLLSSTEKQGWRDTDLLKAEQFLKETVQKESSELFGDPGTVKEEGTCTRLMLLAPVDAPYSDQETWDGTTSQISSYLQSCSSYFKMLALPESRLVYLLSAPEKTAHTLLYGLNIHLTLLSEQSGTSFYVGSAELTPESDLSVTVRRAAEAIRALHTIGAKRGICPWERMKFILLLGHMHQFDHSAVLDNRQLQSLLDYDHRNNTNYTQTLRVFLSNNCSITQSAGYLYIHRHTLLKRLDKIREISGLNLEDWYTRLYMSINLLFHDYFIY